MSETGEGVSRMDPFYVGSAAQAVAESKAQLKLLTVFLQGPDAASSELQQKLLSSDLASVLENTIVLRLHDNLADAEESAYSEARNFRTFMPTDELPSVVCIGLNGKPLLLLRGHSETTDIEGKLQTATQAFAAQVQAAAMARTVLSSLLSSQQQQLSPSQQPAAAVAAYEAAPGGSDQPASSTVGQTEAAGNTQPISAGPRGSPAEQANTGHGEAAPSEPTLGRVSHQPSTNISSSDVRGQPPACAVQPNPPSSSAAEESPVQTAVREETPAGASSSSPREIAGVDGETVHVEPAVQAAPGPAQVSREPVSTVPGSAHEDTAGKAPQLSMAQPNAPVPDASTQPSSGPTSSAKLQPAASSAADNHPSQHPAPKSKKDTANYEAAAMGSSSAAGSTSRLVAAVSAERVPELVAGQQELRASESVEAVQDAKPLPDQQQLLEARARLAAAHAAQRAAPERPDLASSRGASVAPPAPVQRGSQQEGAGGLQQAQAAQVTMPTKLRVKTREATTPLQPPPPPPTTAALSFRLTNGESLRAEFPADTPLSEVLSYLSLHRTDGAVPMQLVTPYPRRVLGPEDHPRSLLELQLAPRSALLLEPLAAPAGRGGFAADASMLSRLWAYISFLIAAVLAYLNPARYLAATAVATPPAHLSSEDESASRHIARDADSARRVAEEMSGAGRAAELRRRGGGPDEAGGGSEGPRPVSGNVHRLHEIRQDNDDESKNSYWNGNSTQFSGDDDAKQ